MRLLTKTSTRKLLAGLDSVRENGDQVGRYGGEEFLVVLAHIDRENAKQVAEKIRSNVAALYINNGQEAPISITVTVGVHYVEPAQLTSVETMLKQADLALYQGKHLGRNRVIVSDELI
jgi:diguanylate cyclase (GGDEF)-like protein